MGTLARPQKPCSQVKLGRECPSYIFLKAVLSPRLYKFGFSLIKKQTRWSEFLGEEPGCHWLSVLASAPAQIRKSLNTHIGVLPLIVVARSPKANKVAMLADGRNIL